MRRTILLILFLFFFFVLPQPIFAIAQFSTSYLATYDVGSTGLTHVTFSIDQVNNLSTVYAKSFSFSLSETSIKNLKVKDAVGALNPDIKTTDNITNITFDFLNRVVGKDKVNHFQIEYDTADIATKVGQIWEVNIPKFEPDENTSGVEVTFKVPPEFGVPSYLEPKPSKTEDNRVYHFSAGSLSNKSISAIFGQEQYYKVNLTYNLSNPLNGQLNVPIALPPDTPYQKVMLNKIDPPLADLQTDPDGNWIANYNVPPNSSEKITAELVIKLNFFPKTAPIPTGDVYTRATNIWNYQDPLVVSRSGDLRTPQAIYDFVVNFLQYSYNRLETASPNDRPGVVFALNNPNQAICTEFTDLFITLARRAGIPAREVQGFALSNNDRLRPISLSKDVLHSWPEYYDQEKHTWVQVDPTWGQTTNGIDYFHKLDLNHLVFAIHGTSPTQPLPAGAYKTPTNNSKDVFVEVIDPVTFPRTNLEVTTDDSKSDRPTIRVFNQSPVAATTHLKIASTPFTYQKDETLSLPPYSSRLVEIDIKNRPIFQPSSVNLIINLDDQKKTLQFTIKPYLNQTYLYLLIFVGSVLGALLTRHLYLRRRRSHAPIHW